MDRARVLIVDDDPVVLQVTSERLRQAGYEVFTRDQALGTSQWVAQHRPDLVLLDVLMPALNGKDLALLLKKTDESIGIILHSSLFGSELHAAMRDTGAIGAIHKADDPARFVVQFERLAMQHRASSGTVPPISRR
jgi:DNA-binding response OmpR family regulator